MSKNPPKVALIRGWKNIAAALEISISTAKRWRRIHQFPVCNLPNGDVATTASLIDAWIASRAELQHEQRHGNG